MLVTRNAGRAIPYFRQFAMLWVLRSSGLEVLSVIYAEFHEMNDLKDMDLAQLDHLFRR